jgi:hypothetical protein
LKESLSAEEASHRIPELMAYLKIHEENAPKKEVFNKWRGDGHYSLDEMAKMSPEFAVENMAQVRKSLKNPRVDET